MNLENNIQSITYDLLLAPSWRGVRHLVLIICLTFIATNQIIVSLYERGTISLTQLFILSFITLLLLLSSFYLNMYLFIPRFFVKGRFITYILSLVLLIIGTVGLISIQEYGMVKWMGAEPTPYSYLHPEGDGFFIVICDMLVYGISLLGFSMPIYFKYYLEEIQKVNQLEKTKAGMEIKQLKEQISPDFLFSVLNRMGRLALTDPVKSSAILMHVSRLLRYQLYEGNKKQLLLTGEIQFIHTYMALEHLSEETLEYEIKTENSHIPVFIPPVLFFPLVQYSVEEWRKDTNKQKIEIHFLIEKGKVTFSCNYLANIDERHLLLKKFQKQLEWLDGYEYSWDETVHKKSERDRTIFIIHTPIW